MNTAIITVQHVNGSQRSFEMTIPELKDRIVSDEGIPFSYSLTITDFNGQQIRCTSK